MSEDNDAVDLDEGVTRRSVLESAMVGVLADDAASSKPGLRSLAFGTVPGTTDHGPPSAGSNSILIYGRGHYGRGIYGEPPGEPPGSQGPPGPGEWSGPGELPRPSPAPPSTPRPPPSVPPRSTPRDPTPTPDATGTPPEGEQPQPTTASRQQESTTTEGSPDETDRTIAERQIGCFIATASYGTPTADEIDVLREFRDRVLHRHPVGDRLVAGYYRYSPPVARWIARTDRRRTIVRTVLVDPLVTIVSAGFDLVRRLDDRE